VGHARQIDSTMSEPRQMLRRFGLRLRQIHISEIDAQGHHHGVTLATILANRNIVDLIGQDIPAIIESQVPANEIEREIAAVEQALEPSTDTASDRESMDWGELV